MLRRLDGLAMNHTSRARVFLLLPALLIVSSIAMAQRAKPVAPNAPQNELSIEQQDALDLLKTTARNLKSETDKLAAGRLQARIADELWPFDEPFAREVFRWAFDAVSQLPPDDLAKEKQSNYISRQASAVKEALRRFGTHDSKQATAWLRAFEKERAANTATAKPEGFLPELLTHIAAQLATTDPIEAARLGSLALSGKRVPDGFGSLLFNLSRTSRTLGDDLFRAAIVTLRRNNYAYDPVLLILANYLFNSAGELHSTGNLEDAQRLANFYVDAAWKQAGGDGNPVPPSSASFYTQLELRALPIVSRYAPARLPELRGQMARIASGLNAEQIQRTELFRSTQRQQDTVTSRNNYTIDQQIERAEKEKNVQVRDALFLGIANSLMRNDPDRALTVAKKIDDRDMRTSTEDDIYLVKVQQLTWGTDSIPEARKIASQFSNPIFRAKVLVQLAVRVWSRNKDQVQATELLSEALTAAAKGDNVPDKVVAQLRVVEQFAKFDTIRAFEVLETAMSTMNRSKPEPPPSATTKQPLLRVKNFMVINGVEMTTGNEATIDSIDFSEMKPLVAQDYMQARLLASKLEQPVQRANYLTTVAVTALKAEKLTSSTKN